MNDCPDAEMRDRLPDLLHERLDEGERMLVMAHVRECVDCRDELELLRGLRLVVAAPVAIDVTRIVASLPPAPVMRSPAAATRRMDWRIAAGVTVMLAAGGAVASFVRDKPVPTIGAQSALVAANDSAAGGSTGIRIDSTLPTVEPGVSVATAELSMGGLSDLDEGDLESLLHEIERLDAIPLAEPEPGATPVSTSSAEESR